MRIYTLEETKDKLLGKVGTSKRDQFELELKRELEAFMDKELYKTKS